MLQENIVLFIRNSNYTVLRIILGIFHLGRKDARLNHQMNFLRRNEFFLRVELPIMTS